MSDAPDELAEARALKRHPIAEILTAAASGALPSEAELDGLKLPSATRRKVADAAADIAATRASGENGAARRQARDAASRIYRALPTELRDPDYLRPPDTTPDDPASLAAQVSRR